MASVHVVAQGECLSQIAASYGFADYTAVYGHPDNADFRKLRPNPDIIYPGDQLAIPDPDRKSVDCSTGAAYRFVVKTPRRKLKIVLQDPAGNALEGIAYQLVVGDATFQGTTGADGTIAHDVPIATNDGTLTLNGQTFSVGIGHLNPMADVDDGGLSGVHARLTNLGFASGEPGDEATGQALRAYRKSRGLDPDGGFDDTVAGLLSKDHGC